MTLSSLIFISTSPDILFQPNLKNFSTQKLHTNCLVLAYIDNTLWIASSQTELANILTLAKSFYNIANIKVNSTKLIFLSNSKPSNYNTITFNSDHSLYSYPTSPSSFLAAGLLSAINLPNNAILFLQSHLNLPKLLTENKLLTLKPDILSILL